MATIRLHIWNNYVELAEDYRHTPYIKQIYEKRKETIERVFADAKEKHAMRYTQYRGLAQVTKWVKLKIVAMNLKKYAIHRFGGELLFLKFPLVSVFLHYFTPFPLREWGFDTD